MENKFKIFVIVAIAILGLSIAGSTFLVFQVLNNTDTDTVARSEKEIELAEVSVGEAILTNIASEGSIQHFAKIQLKIGVDASNKKAYEAFIKKLESRKASIRNELIRIIGEQTYTILSDTSTGKEKLADEIISRLNKLLDAEMIQAVYYEEYFIQ